MGEPDETSRAFLVRVGRNRGCHAARCVDPRLRAGDERAFAISQPTKSILVFRFSSARKWRFENRGDSSCSLSNERDSCVRLADQRQHNLDSSTEEPGPVKRTVASLVDAPMRSAVENQSDGRSRPFLVLGVIASVVLLGALGSWPYGYYRFLRWVVCIAAVVMAFGAYARRMLWAVWLLGFIALLFNPLAPVHLTRDVWRPIDVATAVVLFLLGGLIKGESKDRQGGRQ